VLVSVVIPCFNEEAGIPRLFVGLTRLSALADGLRLEFVLVNDGSSDATGTALETAAANLSGCRVLHHAHNRGVGAAMRTGFAASRGEIVVCYDADLAYPVEDILRLVDAVRAGADIATAVFDAVDTDLAMPLSRRLLTRGAASTYRLVLGRRAAPLRVFSCAFRAYRREVLQALPFESDGFPAAAELLSRALLQGRRVVEVPSTWTDRQTGVSSLKVVPTVAAHLQLLRRLALARWRHRVGG
jgi:dolichol-phosphate mannosyltransferase